MWIMTFIAEYFNDISTAQYEDTVTDCNNLSAVLQTFYCLWLCLKHPASSFVFYLLTHHVTSY